MPKVPVRSRSAVSGRYVKPTYAAKHPNTTVKETTKVVKVVKK